MSTATMERNYDTASTNDVRSTLFVFDGSNMAAQSKAALELERDLSRALSHRSIVRCRRPSCNKCEMMLIPADYWYRCPKCGDVTPIPTNVPLFWNHCPRPIGKAKNGDVILCSYPVLAWPERDGEEHVCKRKDCGQHFTLKGR